MQTAAQAEAMSIAVVSLPRLLQQTTATPTAAPSSFGASLVSSLEG